MSTEVSASAQVGARSADPFASSFLSISGASLRRKTYRASGDALPFPALLPLPLDIALKGERVEMNSAVWIYLLDFFPFNNKAGHSRVNLLKSCLEAIRAADGNTGLVRVTSGY